MVIMYIFYYLIIGVTTTFIFDILNDHVLRPEDRIQFDWGIRTINILLWPYILSVFILDFIIKWLSVIITIIAALTISLRVTDIIISYYIFLVGHLIMSYVLYKDKDWSLFFMNFVWVVIDIIGLIKWG
jgi:hypothetical protein